ncbi:hypothetical protein R1flu_023275 [Riccia fluitans]|uniref:Uncharacterized protein n=1 Tax=Riccia fluitans TaxID=41844 RepID=A0ABD1XSC7_9MARC
MGLPPALDGAPVPQFLGLQAGGTRMDVTDCNGDTVVGMDWHSVSVNNSAGPEVEYRFELVERKNGSDAGSYLSLCGLSKLVDSQGGRADEAKPAMNNFGGTRGEDSSSPYITMETCDSSTGLQEVRVSFHGLEDSRKASSETGLCHRGNHDMGYNSEDGCLPLLRAFFSGPKLSCGGVLSGDGKHSLLDGIGTVLHSFRTSDLSPEAAAIGDFSVKAGNQTKTAPSICKEFPKRTLFEARDLQARCDAFPLAHYRPDCPVWGSSALEQKRDGGGSMVPNSNVSSPVNMNCKKPPKPPKPPRYPGKSTSLDSATAAAISAAKAAALRRRELKQAAAKRKARLSSPPNSGGTPIIALLLTIGFGLLMVFQGLFVQSTPPNNESEKVFVSAPSDEFGVPVSDRPSSFGLAYLDPEVRSSNPALDPGKADMVISDAIYKSMLEIESSRLPQGSDPTVIVG